MKKFTGWGSGLPKSLAHVAMWTNDGRWFTNNMKEFVDHMCTTTSDRLLLIEDEPALLNVKDGMDTIYDAYLAGVAEIIADRYSLPCPAWANGPCRFLPEPVCSGGKHSRQMFIDETPPCMSRRNLFCGSVRLRSIRGKN